MVVLVAVVLSAIAVIILGGIFAHLKMIYAQLRLYEDYYEKALSEYKAKIDKLEKDSYDAKFWEVPEEKDTGWNYPFPF